MPENSEQHPDNSEQPTEKSEQILEKEEPRPQKDDAVPKKKEAPAEAPAPAEPKARGRPKGARDAKPRVKRIPIVTLEEAMPEVKPQRAKAVRVQEPEEAQEEEPPPQEEQPPEPVVAKSPRSLRRERMQAAAVERVAAQKARVARFEKVLNDFMGY